MTLKEFVRDSLIEITSGVAEASAQNDHIAPWVSRGGAAKSSETFDTLKGGGGAAFLVEFDVAVTVSEKADAGGKASISVAQIFSAEGGGGASAEQSKVSRVQFRVPVIFTTLADHNKK
jgi:hypothetical protein